MNAAAQAVRSALAAMLRSLQRVTRNLNVSVNLAIPGLVSLQGTWTPRRTEAALAYEVYVQLATRVTLRPIAEGGSLRKALNSIYEASTASRSALVAAGRDCNPHRPNGTSAGQLVGSVINAVLAPFLSEWHEALCAHEADRPADYADSAAWERTWTRYADLQRAIGTVQHDLRALADQLRVIADVGNLLVDAEPHERTTA